MIVAPNWKELSEETGLRVITLPDGRTISADTIYMVGAFRYLGLGSGSDGDLFCAILVRHPSDAGDAWEVTTMLLEPDADGSIFDIAARAHRVHGGKAGTP